MSTDLGTTRAAGPMPALEPELDWQALAPGRRFPEVAFTLCDEAIDAYLDATGERHPLYERDGGAWAPPLYTTIVRLVKASLGGRWPSGTLQLDHRIGMRRALRRGERLTIDASVARAETRNGRAYFEIASVIRDAQRIVVGTQSSTSMWAGAAPAGTGARAPRPADDPPPPRAARFGPVEARFPPAALLAFGRVAGALDPIHVDPAYGRGTRYGVNVAQGRLVMTLLGRLMLERFGMDWLRGHTLSVRFVRPVLADEAVAAWGAPLRHTPDGFTVWCENAAHETVITGTATLGPPDGPG